MYLLREICLRSLFGPPRTPSLVGVASAALVTITIATKGKGGWGIQHDKSGQQRTKAHHNHGNIRPLFLTKHFWKAKNMTKVWGKTVKGLKKEKKKKATDWRVGKKFTTFIIIMA